MVRLFMMLICLMLFVFSCTQSAPECGDKRVTDAVIKIAKNKAKIQTKAITELRESRSISDEQWEMEWAKYPPQMTFEIKDIRTRGHDEKSGSYACAATLKLNASNKSLERQITYTTELTSDKGSPFFVEVNGLDDF
jgi:hypothetical protein